MATIDDVARRAGVATSTVSYALSGKRPISDKTRVRINKAIEDLGYRQHAGARALASSRTDVIGLVAPFRVGVDVNVIMQFAAGVVAAANSNGYDILLMTQEAGVLERVIGSSMVDAVVVMDIEATDPRIPQLTELGRPAVLIGLPKDPAHLSCVDLDFSRAGAMSAEHLISLGHRSIALLGSPLEVMNRHTSYADRMSQGFTNACVEADVDHAIIPTGPSVAGARDAVDQLFTLLPEVTGVVVHNELALPHVISCLRQHGLKIPRDFSLLALCPESTAISQSIPVTSIDIPAERIGHTAVEMIVALLNEDAPNEVRLLAPYIVKRGSTGEIGSVTP